LRSRRLIDTAVREEGKRPDEESEESSTKEQNRGKEVEAKSIARD
jgi:hypothetical protein